MLKGLKHSRLTSAHLVFALALSLDETAIEGVEESEHGDLDIDTVAYWVVVAGADVGVFGTAAT